MSYPALSTTLQSTEDIGRGETRDKSQDSQLQYAFISFVLIGL
jgi:hypothetical protein